ncbi:MAG: hypothetical protein KDC39_10155 [Actinobacteria bacterium]|nr:hypothetical protein [Actinomycetota bacterium]
MPQDNPTPESAGTTRTSAPPEPEAPVVATGPSWWPVLLWLFSLVAVWVWGGWLEEERGYSLWLGTARPFVGHIQVIIAPGVLFAITVALAAVVYLPTLVVRLSWRQLLVTAWLGTAFWAITLTVSRGLDEFLRPLFRDDDYLTAVPTANEDLGRFISQYTTDLGEYATHVKGHPPGLTVLLTLLARIGVTAEMVLGVLYVLIGASVIVAVGITAKRLGGEDSFRQAMPLLMLAPGVLWIATSPDTVFAGALAWGVAFMAMSAGRLVWAVPGGLLLGLCPFLSYGLLPMGIIVLAVIVPLRLWRATAVAVGAALVVVLTWALLGFNLLDGMAATRIEWLNDPAHVRPYWYFLIANFVLLATILGPGVIAGLPGSRQLPTGVRWLIWLGLLSAVAGTLIGFMRGEVERIWFPLLFWIGLAGAVTGPRRGWLAASAALGIIGQLIIGSPW